MNDEKQKVGQSDTMFVQGQMWEIVQANVNGHTLAWDVKQPMRAICLRCGSYDVSKPCPGRFRRYEPLKSAIMVPIEEYRELEERVRNCAEAMHEAEAKRDEYRAEWDRSSEVCLRLDQALRKARAEVSQLTDHVDLMRDEFIRISINPGASSEIKGLCDRALETTKQRVPVICQRDIAVHDLAAARAEIAKLQSQIAKWIPVSERPPITGQVVLAVNELAGPTPAVKEAWFDSRVGKWFAAVPGRYETEVTHWMEAPVFQRDNQTVGQSDNGKEDGREEAQNAQEGAGDRCPRCGAEEVSALTPRTVYGCGSSDYDRRPGTFKQGASCNAKVPGVGS